MEVCNVRRDIFTCFIDSCGGRSSGGRAPALQAGGQRFESARLHVRKRATVFDSRWREAAVFFDGQCRASTQDKHRRRQTQRSMRETSTHTRTRSQGKEEHTVDALARCGDEGRGELRKALGSRKQAVSQGCPNGGTRLSSWAGIIV